jgi:signal transduction histidine kinase
MLLTSYFLLDNLEEYYLAYHYEVLTRSAKLVADFSVPYIQGTPDVVTVSRLAEDFARQIASRVIVTDHRLRVVGESERIGGLVGSVLEREEAMAALEGNIGQSIQYSEQSRQWVMQVAVPVREDERILGTVFISSSLAMVYRVLGDILRFLQVATVLALLFAGLLGILLAHRITVPVKTLTLATQRMARGDLTQRVRVNSKDEIGLLAGQFNVMASRVQEMTRQLREFVANASHELRTPLTSLNLMVKTLRDYDLDKKERAEFLDDIDTELERMIHLVENLLDLTRLDRLAGEDTMQVTNVVPLVSETLEMLQKRAEQKGITLSWSLPASSLSALVVAHQIRQVVFNLVDNAIKYTQPGGRAKVSLRREQAALVLTVSDTGVGIPKEAREKIFERFYRVDKARSREQGGTGLGLAIVREIVQHHGGRVWVEEPLEGMGSIFIVTLPAMAGDTEQQIY